jgi:hypothetical protein
LSLIYGPPEIVSGNVADRYQNLMKRSPSVACSLYENWNGDVMRLSVIDPCYVCQIYINDVSSPVINGKYYEML